MSLTHRLRASCPATLARDEGARPKPELRYRSQQRAKRRARQLICGVVCGVLFIHSFIYLFCPFIFQFCRTRKIETEPGVRKPSTFRGGERRRPQLPPGYCAGSVSGWCKTAQRFWRRGVETLLGVPDSSLPLSWRRLVPPVENSLFLFSAWHRHPSFLEPIHQLAWRALPRNCLCHLACPRGVK